MTELIEKIAPRWTDEQLAAIETTDCGVVVSAAAGSGKTAALIERTVRMLSDEELRIPADTLLAVTFTNDAAAQMREKLADALTRRLAEEPDNAWLAAQQNRLQNAKITTINSFCYEMVRSNLDQFDFPGTINIMEDSHAEALLREACDTVYENWCANRPDDTGLLTDAFGGKDETALLAALRQLYHFLRSLPFPQKWIRRVQNGILGTDGADVCAQILAPQFADKIRKALAATDSLRGYAARLKLPKCKTSVTAVLLDDTDRLNTLLGVCGSGSYSTVCAAFSGLKFTTFQSGLSAKMDKNSAEYQVEHETAEYLKTARTKALAPVKDIGKLLKKSLADVNRELALTRRIFDLLCMMERDLDAVLTEMKTQRCTVDFADVERMVVQLLTRETETGFTRTPFAEEIAFGGQYRIIVIDEFQDVNNLQEIIFKCLSDSESPEILGRNVFVVGDVKQSIYGFRQANPKLFLEARRRCGLPENAEFLREVVFTRNFRSRDTVIDFVNFLFSAVMSEQNGDVDYSGTERLVCGANYAGGNLPTEVLLLRTHDEDDDTIINDIVTSEDRSDNTAADIELLPEHIIAARKIRAMLDAGTPVYDVPEGRACKPGDFCVLTRSKIRAGFLVKALNAFGVNAVAEEVSGYLRSREISVMLSLLQVLDNPMQDIPMMAVMLSPVLRFSADDAAKLRLLNPQKKLYQLMVGVSGLLPETSTDEQPEPYENHVQEIAEKQDEENANTSPTVRYTTADMAFAEKCAEAVLLIRRLRAYAANMTPGRLIGKIYTEAGFAAMFSRMTNSRRRVANLRLLQKYAAQYDGLSDGGLSGFLRYIKGVSESGGDFAQAAASAEDDNAVRIKTMHKSKGLEFPFVFLCETAYGFNKRDLNAAFLLSEKYGAGMKIDDKATLTKIMPPAHTALRGAKEQELISEELRLLYVALTRAKERLFVTLRVNDFSARRLQRFAREIAQSGGLNPGIVRGAVCMQDWLYQALLLHPDADILRDAANVDFALPQSTEHADIVFSKCTDFSVPAQEAQAQPAQFAEIQPDEALVRRLTERFAEGSAAANSLAAKLSVSELAKPQTPDAFFPQLPRFAEKKPTFTPAQKGTLTHRFMELADFPLAEADTAAELARLTRAGFFTQEENKGVYTDAIRKFFASDFYRRVKDKPQLREKKFLVRLADLDSPLPALAPYAGTDGMLQGVADLIIDEGDGYIIVDYKTDNVTNFDELAAHYAAQLELYRAAFSLILDKPVKGCYLYSFRLAEGREITM